jgi:hypothetical protein
MKYAIISTAALIAVFGLSFLIFGLVRKKLKNKPPMPLHILICAGTAVLVLGISGFVYLNIHYPAQKEAVEVFSGSNDPTVTKTESGYMIDGSGKDTALIFYPGAKVDSEAYLPLMKKIADGGIDCFLLSPPMRMAIFDPNAADKIIDNYNYKTWILSGHSMGGLTAAGYASGHEKADGVVLLAAYPTSPLPDQTTLLSVYGTEDKVLERSVYEDSKKYFPNGYKELVIDGGNHAQFGNYGEQSGDGKAQISREEQQTQTARAVLEFADSIKSK